MDSSSLRDIIASSIDALNTPICCCSWMLNGYPGIVLVCFCLVFKAGPGVGDSWDSLRCP